MSEFLQIRNVTMKFGELLADKDVSFDVPKGTICGLIGPNGAGKTTLFNCIAGYYAPTAG
ncbi:MAG: ATP-binding cassette domain-containing protein, partial [Rectinemataceae bacterium]